MKYIIHLFVLLLLFPSCSSEILKTKTIKIDVGFNFSSKFSGAFYDKCHKKKYFYFSDPVTSKIVKIFDVDLQHISTISLKNFVKSQANISDIVPICLDSFLILKDYTNDLFLLNKKGELEDHVDLNKYIKSKNKYELYSSIFGTFVDFNDGNNLVFAQNLSIYNNEPYKTNYENLRYYYNTNNKIPKYLQIKNLFHPEKKPQITEHLNNFFSTFLPKNSFSFEFDLYNVFNDTLFFSSWYSNKVFVYDLKNKKLIKAIVLKSKFSRIGATPIEITKKNRGDISELVTLNLKKSGLIECFLIDKISKNFFVIIQHEKKQKEDQQNHSLLIYDKNLAQLDEIFLDGKIYSTRFVELRNKDEIIIEKKSKNDRLSKVKVFTSFQFYYK